MPKKILRFIVHVIQIYYVYLRLPEKRKIIKKKRSVGPTRGAEPPDRDGPQSFVLRHFDELSDAHFF